MRPRRRHLQPRSFRGGNQLAARPVHFDPQLAHVLADLRSCLYDRLMHFMLHLVLNRGGNLVHQLHHVRAQLACRWIDDLEFFLDTDGEAVSHGWPSVSRQPLSGCPEPGLDWDFARIIPQLPILSLYVPCTAGESSIKANSHNFAGRFSSYEERQIAKSSPSKADSKSHAARKCKERPNLRRSLSFRKKVVPKER